MGDKNFNILAIVLIPVALFLGIPLWFLLSALIGMPLATLAIVGGVIGGYFTIKAL